jgi:peroxiredoxin
MMKILFLFFFLSLAVLSLAQEKPEGLFINSKAPDFRAKDQYGQEIRLKDIFRDSLVVLVFYRGEWSPYCNKHLKMLEESLLLIREKGARLIAVSPEKPENIKKTIEKTNASYSILYDNDMKIMKAYEVAFEVDERTVNRYKNADIDLAAANGQKGKVYLPVPALYIINKEGTIIYRFFEADYRKRASIQEILEQLK